MKIIAVLDILNGVVVQGMGGARETYRPVRSQLTASVDPSVILNVIRDHFSVSSFYLADLDAIQFRHLNRCTIAELTRCDVSLMVDAGVTSVDDVHELIDLGVHQVVVGLETLPDEQTARQILSAFDGSRIVFSLDMKHGMPLTNHQRWMQTDPESLVAEFVEMGVQNLILLDLAAVGLQQGIPTLKMCQALKRRHPALTIITGGGVATSNDLTAAEDAGADGLLIASALHHGQIDPAELQRFQS